MIRRIRTRVVSRIGMGVEVMEVRKIRVKIMARIGVIIIRINIIRRI